MFSGLFAAGSSPVTAGFAVNENGGLARSGDAEKSDAEEEAAPPAPLGRSQRKKKLKRHATKDPFGRSTRLQKIECAFASVTVTSVPSVQFRGLRYALLEHLVEMILTCSTSVRVSVTPVEQSIVVKLPQRGIAPAAKKYLRIIRP
ncbi:hypothetical protein DFH08DRAFT_798766 [Mycena albidolilacea]|uniref:Uncharacterized protein n=1 Tax=Mycena albidolilacea TaxID=1033008 RepID=A0AAD7AP67_9AGAR|nr:hypothetical protein DFH08DRAFT_798766 [Mycena albidolilacea]